MKLINVDDIEWQKGVFVNPNTEEPLPIIHKIVTIEMLRDWQEEVKAIPLAKVKQAREEIENKIHKDPYLNFSNRNRERNDAFIEVLEILDKLIESEE